MNPKHHLRSFVSLLGLGLMIWLVVTYRPSGIPFGREPARPAVWALLAPLFAVAIGVTRGAKWGDNLGLAVSLAALPWATVLTLTPSFGAPITRQVVALIGSGILLLALLFPTHSEGVRQPDADNRPRVGKSRWIRWCLVLNLVSALNLYLFVIGYAFGASWQLLVLGALLVGLLVGLGLLARNVTGGLLVLALSAILMVPGSALFVAAEAKSTGEAWLFVVLFGPGVVAALGTTASLSSAFARIFRNAA